MQCIEVITACAATPLYDEDDSTPTQVVIWICQILRAAKNDGLIDSIEMVRLQDEVTNACICICVTDNTIICIQRLNASVFISLGDFNPMANRC